MEIERKFKVLELPKDLESYEKEEIEQGYLCIKPTVRIRKSNDNYFLNYKWKNKNIKENKAIQNIEHEMPLTKENYEHLLSKIDNNLIKKTRYKIPIDNNLTVELDVFHNCLEGLNFAEVEFPNVETSENFNKPAWLGDDISFDSRYDNTLLSKISKYQPKDFEN